MSDYVDVWLVVPADAADWAAQALCDAGSEGVLESPQEHGLVKVQGAVLSSAWEHAQAFLQDAIAEATQDEILEQEPEIGSAPAVPFDWEAVMRHHHQPFEVGGILIRPPWSEPSLGPELVLEPGMAFGTGNHETTRLCLEALSREISPEDDRALLDVGTGSGILAFFALLRAPRLRATGCDIDLDAIESANKSALQNGLAERIFLHLGKIEPDWGVFPIIVANLQWNVFQPELSSIVAALSPDGVMLCSGLLLDQAKPMIVLAESLGLQCTFQADQGEWTMLRFVRA